MECFRLLLENLAWIEDQFLCGIRDSRKAGSLWGMMSGVGGVRKSIQQNWLAKGLGLGLLCWGFKWVQERFLGKRPALFKSGEWHFQQVLGTFDCVQTTYYQIRIKWEEIKQKKWHCHDIRYNAIKDAMKLNVGFYGNDSFDSISPSVRICHRF